MAFAPDLEEASPNYPVGYHDEIHKLESRHFWFQGRNRLILWAMKRHFPHMSDFLEIGCGTGFVLSAVEQAFPEAQISGSELFAAGLAHAARRSPRAELFQMDARRVPFRGHFDVVGAFDVIEHIQDDEAVLSEAWKALRPGGGLILTVPQHPWLWSPVDVFAGHARRYRRKELEAKLEAAGFQLLTATSFVTALLPVMLLSRLGKRGAESSEPELHAGMLQNLLGAAASRVELGSIRAGFRWPVGGSLLVVARKAA